MNSLIKWIGGKRNLVGTILPLIPVHKTYVEPFFGAGWVYFKKEKSKVEVINDVNSELINFYRVIKKYPNEFCNEFELLPKSKELFDDFVKLDIDGSSEFKRAIRFYYILMLNFGGRFNRFTFTPRNDGIKQINFDKLPVTIQKAHERLKDTYIEKQDYKKLIQKWDKKDTFFFLDPPYLNTTEKDYEEQFSIENYTELYNLLINIEGKFMLTVKDEPFIKDLFKDFNINNENVFYSVSKEKKREHNELIIMNY